MVTKRTGFSRTELVIVLVVVVVLFALGALVLRNGHRTYDHAQTYNSLKQVALAYQGVHDVYRHLPPAFGPFGSAPAGSQSVHYHLLPFIEQDNLYKAYSASATVPYFLGVYDESTNDGAGVQNFAANLRVFSNKGLRTPYNEDIDFGDRSDPASWDTGTGRARIPRTFEPRGTSCTIMLATRYANNTGIVVTTGAPNCSAHAGKPYHTNGAFFGAAAALAKASTDTSAKPAFQLAPKPSSVDCSFSSFAHSFRNGGLSVALADGSIRTINPSITPEIWNRALQPNSQLSLGEDWDELSRLLVRPTPPGIRE